MSVLMRRSAPFVRIFTKLGEPVRSTSRIVPVRNYWKRRDSFSELSSVMQTMENCMREMDREMNRVFGGIQRASPLKIPQFFSPFDWSRVREIPVVSSSADGRSYKVEMDMQGMEPEDIKITLKNHELTITARRDEKRDDGSRYVRENAYHYTLPKEVNPDTIRSSLMDGILTIEAPLPALEAKEIPVSIESSSNSDSKLDDNASKK